MPEITVNGARVSYVEAGDAGAGPSALLLHSSASSGRQWRSLTALLEGSFATTAPDLWGYGATEPWPGPGPLTLSAEAAAVEAVVAGAGGPVHLVGHSYGGAVAMALALRDPARVASLTLYEPVAFYLLGGDDAGDGRLLTEVRDFALGMEACIAAGDGAGAMAAFVDLWNRPGAFARLTPERQADLACRAAKVVDDFHALFSEPTPLEAFSALQAPALVLRGRDSPEASRRIAELLAGALPDARLQDIPGVGHMAPVTHAEAVDSIIAAHLRRLEEIL